MRLHHTVPPLHSNFQRPVKVIRDLRLESDCRLQSPGFGSNDDTHEEFQGVSVGRQGTIRSKNAFPSDHVVCPTHDRKPLRRGSRKVNYEQSSRSFTYLNPYIPQCAAGTLMLPPISPPRPLKQISTATKENKKPIELTRTLPLRPIKAPSPPLLPLGVKFLL